MSKILHQQLTEICMLLALRKRPLSGYELILKLDEYVGIENLDCENCFFNLRLKGYSCIEYEEVNGKTESRYCITEMGLKHLSEIFELAGYKPNFSEKEIKKIFNSPLIFDK